jgi:hypothetical protein
LTLLEHLIPLSHAFLKPFLICFWNITFPSSQTLWPLFFCSSVSFSTSVIFICLVFFFFWDRVL